MVKLAPSETILVSGFTLKDGKRVPNESAWRIANLVHSYLVRLADADGGWSILYRDPADNRLWELTYPQSYLQGGGPAVLKCLSQEEAEKKFNF